MKALQTSVAALIPKAAAALVATGFVFLAGCTSVKVQEPVETTPVLLPAPPEPAPQPAAEAPPPPPPPAVAQTPEVDTAPTKPVLHADERVKVRVESVPAGAMIVVDGKPVGRAPVDVEVESGSNGFFKEPLTIRARFVASDATIESVSVDEQLGPLERVPLALVFSRDGVQRILRQH